MQRKMFRIEERLARRRAGETVTSHAPVGHELSLVRDIVAAHRHELAALIDDGRERPLTRAAGELGAAIEGSEKAAHSVLKAAENIDEHAKTLVAALKTARERALAQDVRAQVARIYEAGGFHDLAGQRIAKVIALLSVLEERLGAILAHCDGIAVTPGGTARPAANRGLVNGPKLDGDSGHVSQHDIDRMFG